MIRPATSDEASTLTQIALESKSYWGYPEHWLKLWQQELAVSSEFIEVGSPGTELEFAL